MLKIGQLNSMDVTDVFEILWPDVPEYKNSTVTQTTFRQNSPGIHMFQTPIKTY